MHDDINDTETALLTQMRDADLVVEIMDGNASLWKLSPAGLSNIEFQRKADEPRYVFDIDAEQPLADKSSFELLMALQAGGWTWQRLPQKRSNRLALRYRTGMPDEPKLWYTRERARHVHHTWWPC